MEQGQVLPPAGSISPELATGVRDDDPALRPKLLADFVGQPRICSQLSVYINSARGRGQALDHCLCYGPPGLGKTTLARIIANEMGGGFRSVSAPMLARTGDMASILTTLSEGDVLFIDEIHSLRPDVGEVAYTAMEDFEIHITIGEPGRGQAVTVPLPRFTLVGATTRSGMLPKPLRDRFEIDLRLEPYCAEDLKIIVLRSAGLLGLVLEDSAAFEIACRSRGTPRIANRLLRRVRDFAWAENNASTPVSAEAASAACALVGIDGAGLTEADRMYVSLLSGRYRGRPVGLTTIAFALNLDERTVEDEIEPWLIQTGVIERTPRGRVLSAPLGPVQGSLL
jgi:Holliday junction DNA helicase RuvB